MRLFSFYHTPQRHTLAVISIPTAGHIKILIKLVTEVKKANPEFKFKFILASWQGYQVRQNDMLALLEVSDNNVVILESKETVDRKEDAYGRAVELMDGVIEACNNCDSILYDFMTPEGYLAGEYLSIPTICVEPSYIGLFDNSSEQYHQQMKSSSTDLALLEKKYGIVFQDKLKLISGALSLHSSLNIIFSWQSFIHAGNFLQNPHESELNYFFMRPSMTNDIQLDEPLNSIVNSGKKVVYFSLGTIASSVIWEYADTIEGCTFHDFVRLIYNALIDIFTDRSDLILIISSGRDLRDIIGERPLSENIYCFETLPQAELLHFTDVFITHCGANGVNEAIDHGIPTIGIPLMFDQHECAESIEKLGIGQAFLLPVELRNAAVNFESNLFFREPLNEPRKAREALELSIEKILNHDFSASFENIKADATLRFKMLPSLLDREKEKLLEKRLSQESNIMIPRTSCGT